MKKALIEFNKGVEYNWDNSIKTSSIKLTAANLQGLNRG